MRLGHETRSEASLLHTIRRTADVEIDFVIAKGRTDGCGLCKLCGIGTAKLERYGMLRRIEPQKPLSIAMQDRFGRHHFSVEQGMPRQLAVEEAAVPVRPIHHRGNAELVIWAMHSSCGFAIKSWRHRTTWAGGKGMRRLSGVTRTRQMRSGGGWR